jgi:hypothetical protein
MSTSARLRQRRAVYAWCNSKVTMAKMRMMIMTVAFGAMFARREFAKIRCCVDQAMGDEKYNSLAPQYLFRYGARISAIARVLRKKILSRGVSSSPTTCTHF